MKYSPAVVKRALSKKRFGGTCLVNICAGGETLLCKEVVDYTRVLLEEGHYVMIVTNGTITDKMKKIADFPRELLNRLFFKMSYHYLQLKKQRFIKCFFENIRMIKDAGASFTLEVTPYDDLVPYIDELCNIAIKNVGSAPHITIARDESVAGKYPILINFSEKDYYEVWGKIGSSLFEFKKTIYGVKRKEFCYAGDWSAWVHLGSGEMKQCLCSIYSQNIFDDLDQPIRFHPIGSRCKLEHCYNGHSYLVLGVIPELHAPMYGDIRNNRYIDGDDWLTPEMKSFMNGKLIDMNQEYPFFKKIAVNFENDVRSMRRRAVGVLERIKKISLK